MLRCSACNVSWSTMSGLAEQKRRRQGFKTPQTAWLAAWPKDLETRVGSVQVAATQVTLTMDVPYAGSSESLSAALQGVAGWDLQPPRTEVNGGQARVTPILRPQQRSDGALQGKVAARRHARDLAALHYLDWLLIAVATGAVAAGAWAGTRWWGQQNPSPTRLCSALRRWPPAESSLFGRMGSGTAP